MYRFAQTTHWVAWIVAWVALACCLFCLFSLAKKRKKDLKLAQYFIRQATGASSREAKVAYVEALANLWSQEIGFSTELLNGLPDEIVKALDNTNDGYGIRKPRKIAHLIIDRLNNIK